MTQRRHLRSVPKDAPLLATAPTRAMAPVFDGAYRSRTRAEVERLYPKSDPAEVASLQDTEIARRFGICAAWVEGGSLKFIPGRLVD